MPCHPSLAFPIDSLHFLNFPIEDLPFGSLNRGRTVPWPWQWPRSKGIALESSRKGRFPFSSHMVTNYTLYLANAAQAFCDRPAPKLTLARSWHFLLFGMGPSLVRFCVDIDRNGCCESRTNQIKYLIKELPLYIRIAECQGIDNVIPC